MLPLVNTPKPDQVTAEDRHMFACLLAAAAQEPYDTAKVLGRDDGDLPAIRRSLPSLAAANYQYMRWKRYLYTQVCDRNAG